MKQSSSFRAYQTSTFARSECIMQTTINLHESRKCIYWRPVGEVPPRNLSGFSVPDHHWLDLPLAAERRPCLEYHDADQVGGIAASDCCTLCST